MSKPNKLETGEVTMENETLEQTAERLVHQNVNVCLSSLVATLAQGCGAVRPLDGWNHYGAKSLEELTEQASELAAPVADYEESARQAGWTQTPEGWWWRKPASDTDKDQADFYFLGSGPFLRQPTAADACEWDDEPAYDWEVFEHWAVSQWFGEQLAAKGEKVDFDFAGLVVWARTTTGQGIAADGVILDIARDSRAFVASLV